MTGAFRAGSRTALFAPVLLLGLPLLPACSGSPPSSAGVPASTPISSSATTPTVVVRDEGQALLSRVVDALGGAAVVDGVKTLQAAAKVKRKFPGGNEVEFDSKTALLFPDRYRQEAKLPMGEIVTVWVPAGAFTDMGSGPVLLPEAQDAALEDSFRRNLVSLLQARSRPGFRATASAGEKSGSGTRSLNLDTGSLHTTLEIEEATGLVRRLRYLSASAAAGIGGETVVEFSDWRTVQGLKYPFGFSSTIAGKPAHSGQVQELTVNAPLEPSLFEPKGAPVPAEPVVTPTAGAAKTPTPRR